MDGVYMKIHALNKFLLILQKSIPYFVSALN